VKTFKPLILCFFVPILLLNITDRAHAASFTFSSSSTSTQTLSGGQVGYVTSTGTLGVNSSNPAITITSSGTVILTNAGTISQAGAARAIQDYKKSSGLTTTITNSTSALIQSTQDDAIKITASTFTLNNYGTISSTGGQALDLGDQTISSSIIYNYSAGIMQATDSDAIHSGVNSRIYNYGIIRSYSTTPGSNNGISAQTNTGLAVTNSGTIAGAHHGISGDGTATSTSYTMTINNLSGATISGSDGSGINVDGTGAYEVVTITNAGTISGSGVTGDGDGVDVDGIVHLTNSGTIQSLNSYAASGNATSEGVTVGGGTIYNTGTIAGYVASTNSNTLATGRGITFAGIDTTTPAQTIYADAVVTNSGTITGQKDSAIYIYGTTSGFIGSITNSVAGIITGGGTTTDTATIRTGDENDTLINYGTITNTNSGGYAIYLGGGTNTLQILGGTISGNISGGTGTSSMTIDLGAGKTFSYSGTISQFKSVQLNSGTVNLAGSITSSSTAVNSSSTLHLFNGSAGTVAVNSNGKLTGAGTVGALTINSGGIIAPGEGIGTTTAGNTTLNGGGILQLQISTTGTWDLLAVNGSLDLTNLNASSQFIIQVEFLDTNGSVTTAGSIIDSSINQLWSDFITTTEGFKNGIFSSSSFVVEIVDANGNTVTTDGAYSVVTDSNGTGLTLQYTAATPEPAETALVVGGIALLFAFNYGKRRSQGQTSQCSR
jgi:hypothetical protein